MSQPPRTLTHILETCLYVRDMSIARSFYRDNLGLSPDVSADRITTFPLGNTTLILFALGGNMADMHPNDNLELTIPKHGPRKAVLDVVNATAGDETSLKLHYCLAAQSVDEVKAWEAYFAEKDVKVVGTMQWERGGRSVYFEDPDGHVGEIASRGIWGHY